MTLSERGLWPPCGHGHDNRAMTDTGTPRPETHQSSTDVQINTGLTVTFSVRNYLAPQLLWTARRDAWLCREREDQLVFIGDANVDYRHRSYATSCVLSAVAFLEAFVNAVWQDMADVTPGEHSHYTHGIPDAGMTIMRELWTGREQAERAMSLLGKFQLALVCCGCGRMDRGAEPYQSADALITLRNALVHFKPVWWHSDADDARFVRTLRDKITTERENRQAIGEPWFPNKAMGAGAADWACNTVITFTREWHAQMNLAHDFEATYIANLPSVENED